jgi:hypothetical protein
MVRYEMLQRVHRFGQSNPDLFPPSSVGAQALDVIRLATTQLGEHAVSKMSAAREGTRPRAAARLALASRLTAIARSAKVIAREKPGFDVRFSLPRQRTDLGLLTAGRLFVEEGEAHRETLVEYGMAPDFVATLTRLVNDFGAARQGVETGKDGHLLARASIESALTTALEAVRKLDVIVANRLHDDPARLAVWQRDRRIDYGRRVRRVAPPVDLEPDPEPVAPIPVTPAATPRVGSPAAAAPEVVS